MFLAVSGNKTYKAPMEWYTKHLSFIISATWYKYNLKQDSLLYKVPEWLSADV